MWQFGFDRACRLYPRGDRVSATPSNPGSPLRFTAPDSEDPVIVTHLVDDSARISSNHTANFFFVMPGSGFS
jgi:hypothetical protein